MDAFVLHSDARSTSEALGNHTGASTAHTHYRGTLVRSPNGRGKRARSIFE